MKNIIRSVLLLIIVAMATCLTACGLFVEDKQHALVELTSTSGYAAVASSYNGLGRTWSGLYGAQRKVCKVSLKDEKDVLAKYEWSKVYGALFGCEKEASKLYEAAVSGHSGDNSESSDTSESTDTTENTDTEQ